MLSNTTNDTFFQPTSQYPRRHRGVYIMSMLLITLFAGGYILFRAAGMYRPPEIMIDEPKDGALLSNRMVIIKGSTDPNSELSINNYQAFSDTEGNFIAELPFLSGFNIIDVRAKNRLGREGRVVLRVVVK